MNTHDRWKLAHALEEKLQANLETCPRRRVFLLLKLGDPDGDIESDAVVEIPWRIDALKDISCPIEAEVEAVAKTTEDLMGLLRLLVADVVQKQSEK